MHSVLAIFAGLVLFAFADCQQKPWVGKWESTGRHENFQAFVTALGIPLALEYGGDSKVYNHFIQEDDKFFHKVTVPDAGYENRLEFKIGGEHTASFNGTQFKYKYTEEGNELRAEYSTPSAGKTIHDTYRVAGQELEKTYKIGEVSAKRWFKKVDSR